MIETRDDTSKLLDIKIFSCFIIKLYTEYFLGICKEFICKCPKVVCTCGWRLYKSTILKLGGWNLHVASTHRESGHGRYEAGLRGRRGHWGRGRTEGLGRFAWHFKMGVVGWWAVWGRPLRPPRPSRPRSYWRSRTFCILERLGRGEGRA